MAITITQVVITMLVVSMISIGLGTFYSTTLESYGKYDQLSDQQKQAIEDFNVADDIRTNITNPLKDKIDNAGQIPFVSETSFFIDAIVQSVKLSTQLPGILLGMIGNLSILLQSFIPGVYINIFNGIVLAFILLLIVAVIMRVQEL